MWRRYSQNRRQWQQWCSRIRSERKAIVKWRLTQPQTHTYICTHIHTHAHTHTPTHTHTLSLSHTHTYMERIYKYTHMGWLRLVGSLKTQVSFAECRLFDRALLQKRPIMLRSLLINRRHPIGSTDSGDNCETGAGRRQWWISVAHRMMSVR